MDWLADVGGFPSTLSRCPQAGDRALTAWLAAQRGSTIQGAASYLHAALGGRYEENGLLGRCKRWVQVARWRPWGTDGVVAWRRGRRGRLFHEPPMARLITPYPQPLAPSRGPGEQDAIWLIRGQGRLSVHIVAVPTGGRRGADDAAGGLFAAAPQGRYGLVAALPLAGGTKWRWVAISFCLYPVQCVADGCRPCETRPHTLLPTDGAARSTAARNKNALRVPRAAMQQTWATTFGPPKAHTSASPAKGSVKQTPTQSYGAAANSPPTTPSAPRRPPIGHRHSVYGKPRKAARHAISRPTPLAP